MQTLNVNSNVIQKKERLKLLWAKNSDSSFITEIVQGDFSALKAKLSEKKLWNLSKQNKSV